MLKQPCVYILASDRNGTLYVGVTSDLIKRVWEHKNDLVPGFTKRYNVHELVWYELHESMESAIAREKAIKEWKRRWKLELIERGNPEWKDLYPELLYLDSGFRGCVKTPGRGWSFPRNRGEVAILITNSSTPCATLSENGVVFPPRHGARVFSHSLFRRNDGFGCFFGLFQQTPTKK